VFGCRIGGWGGVYQPEPVFSAILNFFALTFRIFLNFNILLLQRAYYVPGCNNPSTTCHAIFNIPNNQPLPKSLNACQVVCNVLGDPVIYRQSITCQVIHHLPRDPPLTKRSITCQVIDHFSNDQPLKKSLTTCHVFCILLSDPSPDK